MQWEQTKEWFLQCKTCPFPPFLGLSLQMQRLDDIDRVAMYRKKGSCPGEDLAYKARGQQEENSAECSRRSDGRPYLRILSHLQEGTTCWRSTF